MKTIEKLEDGSFDLQVDFSYRGINFTCKSYGKGSTAFSLHVVSGIFNGVERSFSSSTRKQAKDMFKKMVRKNR